MKRKDIQELKQKSITELTSLLKEERDRLEKLRFDLLQGKVKNVGEIRELRKKVARILTFLNAPKQ